MNIDTGEIRHFSESEGIELAKLLKRENWVPIEEKDMTEKERKEKRVSLHDYRSKLGKELTKNRKRKLKRKGVLA